MEAYYQLSALALERFWPREVLLEREKSEANLITDGLLLFFLCCVLFILSRHVQKCCGITMG